jgi:hypothetical protein
VEAHGGGNFKGEGFAIDGVEIVRLFGRVFSSKLLVENEILIERLKQGTRDPKLDTSGGKIADACSRFTTLTS